MPKELSHKSSEDVFGALERLLQSQFEESTSVSDAIINLGAPIVSIAILDAGTIATKIIGPPSRQIPSSPPFDNDTIFQACSISKSMTSIVINKLCQNGVLDLEAPISQYLSQDQLTWISTPKTYSLAAKITLSQLLSHTSGLSCTGFSGYPKTPYPTISQILRGIPPANNIPVRVSLMPGTKFAYSGGGYTVIQLILETVLQKQFDEIMQETLLSPLEMSRSTFSFLPKGEKNFADSFSNGRLSCEPGHHALPESAAAGLWTTPSDLLKAVHAVQRSLSSRDGFLTPESARAMLTEVEDNEMALGWMTSKDGNHFHHTGGNEPGYRCFASGYADFGFSRRETEHGAATSEAPKESGICIMTSSAVGHIVYAKLIMALLYLKSRPMLTQTPPIVPLVDRERKVDESVKEWCGKWGPGLWEVKLEKERVFVSHGNLPPTSLVSGAIPPHLYREGLSIDLVADGLSLMLRLGWDGGARVIEIWQDGSILTLKKEQQ